MNETKKQPRRLLFDTQLFFTLTAGAVERVKNHRTDASIREAQYPTPKNASDAVPLEPWEQ